MQPNPNPKRAEAQATQEVVWNLIGKIHERGHKILVDDLRGQAACRVLATLIEEGKLDMWDVEARLLEAQRTRLKDEYDRIKKLPPLKAAAV